MKKIKGLKQFVKDQMEQINSTQMEVAPTLDQQTGLFDYQNHAWIKGKWILRSTLPSNHNESLDSYFTRYNLDKQQVLESNARIFLLELSELLPKDQELAIKNVFK